MYEVPSGVIHAVNPARDLIHRRGSGIAIFLATHVPLALVMYQSSLIASLHAMATLAVGLAFAALGRQPERVVYVGAYIMGAEVLWRMTRARVFWEFGKYAIVAIFIVAILRFYRLRGPRLPLVYFCLLLPSAVLTLSHFGLAEGREQISFNLSGPFALMICSWLFWHYTLRDRQLDTIFLGALGPITGIATIALYSTLTASTIQFTNESNFTTSGGFGPNQVSNMLGLGALLAFIWLVRERRPFGLQIVITIAVIVFGALSALTFSRSGLYNAGVSAIVLLLFQVRDGRSLIRLATSVALLFVITDALVLPRLESFTGGALSARFRDPDLTKRDVIARADLQVWAEHPLFGVGPGVAVEARKPLIGPAAAHTELTRLPAEHGIFGVVALFLLLLMAVRNIKRAQTPANKGIVAALIIWVFFFMLNSAIRLAAPAFLFGLTFITLLSEHDSDHSTQTWSGRHYHRPRALKARRFTVS